MTHTIIFNKITTQTKSHESETPVQTYENNFFFFFKYIYIRSPALQCLGVHLTFKKYQVVVVSPFSSLFIIYTNNNPFLHSCFAFSNFYGLWLCTCCWFWNAFKLSSALCSRAICRLTVLLRVKVREQNGHGTRIPWCRCRMWARKFVSYPYSRSQKGHFNFFPATNRKRIWKITSASI